MKLFFRYVLVKKRSVLLFICFSIITAVTGYLYGVPFEATAYIISLCFIFGMIAAIFDFTRFRKRHETLEYLTENIAYVVDSLPETADIREQDYINLIEALRKELVNVKNENARQITDLSDYYTLWMHQIKTPIAAMRLLLEENGNSEIEEQLFRIEQYAEMALTYIRCDGKTSDYVLKRCDLDSIIKQSVRKYLKSFIRKKLTFDFTPTELSVLTDEKWLCFVIEQILSNSLKYTKTGKISIYAENRNTLVIKDTGIGIAAEDLPRITQKGYTGYNGREDKKSTGLGLFLCGKVIGNLGHEIKISSEVGKGTVVRIIFTNQTVRYE